MFSHPRKQSKARPEEAQAAHANALAGLEGYGKPVPTTGTYLHNADYPQSHHEQFRSPEFISEEYEDVPVAPDTPPSPLSPRTLSSQNAYNRRPGASALLSSMYKRFCTVEAALEVDSIPRDDMTKVTRRKSSIAGQYRRRGSRSAVSTYFEDRNWIDTSGHTPSRVHDERVPKAADAPPSRVTVWSDVLKSVGPPPMPISAQGNTCTSGRSLHERAGTFVPLQTSRTATQVVTSEQLESKVRPSARYKIYDEKQIPNAQKPIRSLEQARSFLAKVYGSRKPDHRSATNQSSSSITASLSETRSIPIAQSMSTTRQKPTFPPTTLPVTRTNTPIPVSTSVSGSMNMRSDNPFLSHALKTYYTNTTQNTVPYAITQPLTHRSRNNKAQYLAAGTLRKCPEEDGRISRRK